MLPMPDGVKLATDIYRPAETNRAYPVVLGRIPYNKAMYVGLGAQAVQRGFVFVAQDARGRFASMGENMPFDMDGPDGLATLEWIRQQPWCNGKVAVWGGSAGAINQYQILATGKFPADAQFMMVGAPSLYDVIYVNGIFRKALIEDWLKQNKFSSNALPLWVGHPVYDDYWKGHDASRQYRQSHAPAIHIAGYWDIFAQETINGFNGLQKKGGKGARGNQRLIIGPWTHLVMADAAGDFKFANAKNPPGDVEDAWKWFEHWLKGAENGTEKLPAVTYYVVGDAFNKNAPGNEWREAATWPPFDVKPQKWFLNAEKKLSTDKPGKSEPLEWTYNPADPAPTIGGIQLSLTAGPKDRSALRKRADVLSFTSDVLEAPVEVTGRVRAVIYLETDVPDTDIFVTLCDVYPDGRVFNLCEGMLRARFRDGLDREKMLKPGAVTPLEIDMWSTSVIFDKGHRIEAQVTSSSSPGFDPNPNTGAGFRENKETRPAHNKLHVDGRRASHLLLPVIGGK